MRDFETVDMAIHAALTGHLVVSTLHTNDSPSAIIRLMDIGIAPYLVTSSVRGIVSQRLVRKICPRCKTEREPKRDEWEAVFSSSRPMPDKIYEGKGCDLCSQTGYLGRLAISEVMVLTDKLRNFIMTKPDSNSLLAVAKEEGLITLMDEAAIKVGQGITKIGRAHV